MAATPAHKPEEGFIDCITHALTGAQILFYLSLVWNADNERSAILWCAKGDAEWKVNALRVALSKERKAREMPRTFELRFSDSWPYTYNGIRGEAVKVTRSGGSRITKMRAAFHELMGHKYHD